MSLKHQYGIDKISAFVNSGKRCCSYLFLQLVYFNCEFYRFEFYYNELLIPSVIVDLALKYDGRDNSLPLTGDPVCFLFNEKGELSKFSIA
jgi:hypothetical protein